MGVQRSLVERLASAVIVGFSTWLLLEKYAGGLSVGEHRVLTLATVTFALVHPGLGAATVALLPYFVGPVENPIEILFVLPTAVLAFRFWPQSLTWVFATLSEEPILSYSTLGVLVFSLKATSPEAAAFFMAFYTLFTGFRAALSTPISGFGCRGLVVVQGLQGQSVRSPLELASEWFYTSVLGPPRLLLLVIVYAAAGAAASRLNTLGASKLAGTLPAHIMLLAFCIVSLSLGLAPPPAALIVPCLDVAMTFGAELRRIRLPTRKPRNATPPAALAPNLVHAWVALCEAIRGGERLILVFGPSGCGKSTLIREVARACRVRLTDSRKAKGKIFWLEKAEMHQDLPMLIRRQLALGAIGVILETSRPLKLIGLVGSLPIKKAIYVPPPDEEARKLVIKHMLKSILSDEDIEKLAEITQAYSLRNLTIFCNLIKNKFMSGLRYEQAAASALKETPADLTLEEILECEKFIQNFEGIVIGFVSTTIFRQK